MSTRPTLTISPPSSAERALKALRTWEPGGTGEPSGDDLCALISERLKAAAAKPRDAAPVRRRLPGRSAILSIRRPRAAAMSRARPKVQTYQPGARVDAKAKSLATWRSGIIVEDLGGELIDVQIGSYILGVPRSCVRPPKEPHVPQHAIVATPISVEPVGEFSPRAKGLPPLSGPVTIRPASARMSGTSRGVMRPQPKPRGRIRDGDYLRYVRQQQCCSCQTVAMPRDAHHFGLPIGDVRGVGQKVDDLRTVPLCRRCHDHWHRTRQLLGQPGCKEWAEVYLYRVQVTLLIAYFCLAEVDREAEELLERELDRPAIEAGAEDGP